MENIGDLLSSISILLVFLSMLMTYLSTVIQPILDQSKLNKDMAIARGKFEKKIKRVLFQGAIPVTLIFILVTYTLLPQTVEII